MPSHHVDHTGDSRLRFLFDDVVVSCGLAAGATIGDIARTLDEMAPLRYGDPRAISLILGSPKRGLFAREKQYVGSILRQARKKTPSSRGAKRKGDLATTGLLPATLRPRSQ